ncbi:MAG: polysaccharide biosynthesis protein [Thaumarchaeota archaeon]|nr:polysaccharide biosynthesis protein [Nitrososphaerota archaeon]
MKSKAKAPRKDIYRGSVILVTGGTGSIGLELAKDALTHEPKEVRLMSNDENGLFDAKTTFGGNRRVTFRLGDVRDPDSVNSATMGCDVIFHAAALKHVNFCEENPSEAISTNIIGTQNVMNHANRNGVRRFVFVSTDKAVNPISTMGATKLLAEKLTVNGNRIFKDCVFCSVRFGNVLGSRGSVLKIFQQQVRHEGRMTVTDPKMTRFIMLPSEASKLVLEAGRQAAPGETFILKMPKVKIGELARASLEYFSKRFGMDPAKIKVQTTGMRPGEKMHEELMTVGEAARAREKGQFYVIPPQFSRGRGDASAGKGGGRGYSSESGPWLGRREITSLISALYGA